MSELTRLAEAFHALSRNGKGSFLASVAHEQTIKARLIHHENPNDLEGLRRSNELVHRLAGYIGQVLSRDTELDQDSSVVSMIFEYGFNARRLWLWLDLAREPNGKQISFREINSAIDELEDDSDKPIH